MRPLSHAIVYWPGLMQIGIKLLVRRQLMHRIKNECNAMTKDKTHLNIPHLESYLTHTLDTDANHQEPTSHGFGVVSHTLTYFTPQRRGRKVGRRIARRMQKHPSCSHTLYNPHQPLIGLCKFSRDSLRLWQCGHAPSLPWDCPLTWMNTDWY
jgi:hypothetical protein